MNDSKKKKIFADPRNPQDLKQHILASKIEQHSPSEQKLALVQHQLVTQVWLTCRMNC